MPLKYAAEINKFSDCPPVNSSGRSGDAFRFVFTPVGPDSFIPVALLPSRQGNPVYCCSDWGLSMFDSSASARKRFSALMKKFPNIGKRVGTHLAKGSLTPACGPCTPPKKGHFDLHPEKGIAVHSLFSIVGVLP